MHTKVSIKPADKIANLPPYIFAEIQEWIDEVEDKNVIDLSIGNPDAPTPQPVLDAAIKSMNDVKNHGYTEFKGKLEFRQAVSDWFKNRYNVDIDPKTEVISLLGAKEGLAHMAMAHTNPGDINIVPDPYYPVHSRGTWLSCGDVHHVPLKAENDFLPDLDSIPMSVAEKAKIFFINYPNNPTTATAPKEFYENLVKFCKKHNIIICSDLAYGCISFDGYKPPSILEIEGAKDIAVEIHTFSKTFNMAGWRVGFAVGNKDIIKNLFTFKSNVDYGTAAIIQDAAIAALKLPFSHIEELTAKYSHRRDILVEGFNKLGWNIEKSKATMFLWLPVPDGLDSKTWCKKVLHEAGVMFTPGIAFGENSDKYFRVSLVAPDEKLIEALSRLEKANITYSV